MTDSQYEELQSQINALTKIVKQNTKLLNSIAKALHLLPVTEKEERELQITQRKNLNQAAKINEELDSLENKIDANSNGIGNLFSNVEEIYAGILGQDVLGADN